MTGSGEAGGEERKRKQRAIAANSGGDGKRVRTRLSPKKRLAAPPQPVPFDQETHRLFPDRFRGTAATTAPRKLLPEPASPRKRSPPSRRSLFPPTKKHTACSRTVSGERQQPPPRRASVRTRSLPEREALRPAAARPLRPRNTPPVPGPFPGNGSNHRPAEPPFEPGFSPKEKLAAPPQPVPFNQETHRLFPDRFRGTAATTAPQSLRSNHRSPHHPTRKHAAVPAPMREAIIFLAVR